MKKYLSIDMDFWNDLSKDVVESDIDKILCVAKKRNIPMIAVMNHHQLTNIVSSSNARLLLNIDRHSDLCDTTIDTFECGSWVSYVKWRKEGKYVWMHSNHRIYGECNGGNPIFLDNSIRWSLSDWKHLSRKNVDSIPSVNSLLFNCVGVGLVLSPEFVDFEFEPIFKKMVKKYNIPYVKGRRNESEFQAHRRPSGLNRKNR